MELVHCARSLFCCFFLAFLSHTHHKLAQKCNFNFFKLLVAECSSCFNEKAMQEKDERVVADHGFRPPQTEEGSGPKFSTS